MSDDKFSPRTAQSFDIPPRVRVSLYLAGSSITDDFEAPVLDNKITRAITDAAFDRHMRNLFMQAKLAGRLSFNLVKAGPVLKELKEFLPHLSLDEHTESIILGAAHLVEVTAEEPMESGLHSLQAVHLAAAVLAKQSGAVLIEPYSLKVFGPEDPALDDFLKIGDETPSIKLYLSIIQSRLQGTDLLSTSHGLARFGLPDFRVAESNHNLADPLEILLRTLAQSFLAAVIDARERGEDRFSLLKPLPLTSGTLMKANSGLPLIGGGKTLATIPLKLVERPGGLYLDLGFHGRRHERSAQLAETLSQLGPICS